MTATIQEADLLTPERLESFLTELQRQGRREATIRSYRDVLTPLCTALPGGRLGPGVWEDWKREMEGQGLQPTTINQRLSALNSYLRYIGRKSWRGDSFIPAEKKPQPELTRKEYQDLLSAARRLGKENAYLLIKLMGSFGVELKDLPSLTVEAVKAGRAPRQSGGAVAFTNEARGELLGYIRRRGIHDGPVFRTASGLPMDRKHIHWLLGSVCAAAQVDPAKVSPRSLQRMYQRTRAQIQERVALIAERDYQQLLFTEQRLFGWEEEKAAGLP